MHLQQSKSDRGREKKKSGDEEEETEKAKGKEGAVYKREREGVFTEFARLGIA